VKQHDGVTLVAQGDPAGDTYTMRLTEAPDRSQQVRILSDGQTIASDACLCDARFHAATATTPAYVVFDATNWYLPITVRLTSNAAAPATDPFQPLVSFPQRSDENAGDRGADEHGMDQNGEGELVEIHPPVQKLLCNGSPADQITDPDADADAHESGDEHDNDDNEGAILCEDHPMRQPVILPREMGAGAPPEFTVVSGNLVVEATSPAGATVSYTPATAIGEVGSTTITYTAASGATYALGVTTVTVTVVDEAGNYQHTTFTITVRDTTPPVITTFSPNLVVEATMPSGAVVTYAAATATDAVGPVTIGYSKASGATFALGTTTVTVTATDAYGNASSKTFSVTVRDTTAPVITAPNMTVDATAPSGWRVGTFAATATDAVGPVTLTYNKATGTYLPFGVTPVTVTARDAFGNTSTATFTVTVVDTIAPVITAPDVTVEATGPAGAKAYYTPTATDAVGPITLAISIPSGSTFAIGTTTVTVTATDGHGNVATKTFIVTVRDTTAPVITSLSGNLTVEATGPAGAAVTYAAATATDAVGPISIGYSQASGTTFPIGLTTVTVTATDAFGNASSKTFKVTVRDTTAPVITSWSANLLAEATSPAGAAVTYAAASATDAVGPVAITYSKASGATFALGTTTVTVTATDAFGNASSKTFTVTVRDTTAPAITAPNMTVEATNASGWKVGTFAAGATDAVGPVTLTFNKAAGTYLPFGVTTVTVTAKDAYLNTSTATFTVTVVDTTAPVITAPNVTVEATSAAGAKAYYMPTATDAVGPVTLTTSIASGTQFALGTTTVTVTATDGRGNVATKTFTVTVRDTTAPALTVSANVVVEATSPAGALASYAAATATDAVGPVAIAYSQASGTLFPLGVTTVTVTATDGAGNVTTKTFSVTVRDTTAPAVAAGPNVVAEATSSAGAAVTYAAATATDLVGPVTITYSKASGAIFAVGTTTVTVTAKDAAGNTSTATFTVTVRDTIAPVITAPNMTVEATSASGWKVGTFAATATDAVGPVTLTYNKAAGTYLPFGTTTVTVTARDAAGNTSTATFTVTVVDTTAPVITAPDITVEATSAAGARAYYTPTATDAAGAVTITISLASGSTFALGSTSVTVTATDAHGNVATKTFNVIVRDTTAPTITSISGNLIVASTSSAGAVVTYAAAVATDAVGPVTITYSSASGTLFAKGLTYVYVTATDAAGNSSTRSFWVWVY
jgi:hypothetical protein